MHGRSVKNRYLKQNSGTRSNSQPRRQTLNIFIFSPRGPPNRVDQSATISPAPRPSPPSHINAPHAQLLPSCRRPSPVASPARSSPPRASRSQCAARRHAHHLPSAHQAAARVASPPPLLTSPPRIRPPPRASPASSRPPPDT